MTASLDEALDRLRGAGGEIAGGGMPNHGPMAAEALVALGRGDVVARWAERYRTVLGTMPEASSAVTMASWRDALGAPLRFGDWAAFFRDQVAKKTWRTVLASWIGLLVPAMNSGGTHGLIRTAHALRALEDAETPLRIEELAVALAFWAAYYRAFPTPARLSGTLGFAEALARVPRLMRGRDRRGFPRDLAHVAGSDPDLAIAVDRAAPPESIERALGEITEAGARLYLANADRQPLVLLHIVTSAAALRLLLPHLSSDLRPVAFAGLWQAAAANAAMFSDEPARDGDDQGSFSEPEIIDRSVETEDPHAIKFAEACLREHRLRPRPVYLAAARDFAERARRARGWSEAERVAAGMEFP
ncbi:MAG TPA: questin oxidase family protein [Haliangiales bacterium]|nr:questin oxidase family protein [Haliangiales bacterium]